MDGPAWKETRKKALSASPDTMDKAYEVVRKALETAGGKHSFLMERSMVQYNDTSQWRMPVIDMTGDSILVITVPDYSGNETQATSGFGYHIFFQNSAMFRIQLRI